PVVQQLCHDSGLPIVSTSANRSGRPSLRTAQSVKNEFKNEIDCILDAAVGNASEPSAITDALTGKSIRG
ncbi:MAG: hypothetical protein HOD23_11075, partial [Proteobacteria bacterium]|nr:hypothetical protein [Pseudomonadota bacterium]